MKEKLIYTDIQISELIFDYFKITKPQTNSIEEEIRINTNGLLEFINDNNDFFEKLYTNIADFINQQNQIQTKMNSFWIPYTLFVDHVFTIVVRSIYYYNIEADDANEENHHFINRRTVVFRINKYIDIYRFGNLYHDIKALIIRSLIDSTSKNFFLENFIIKKQKTKFSKDIFIKFNLIYNVNLRNRLNIDVGLVPAQRLNDEYIICAS